jgi:shikimate kinase
MMGAGKSALGRELCERTGREHVDTDLLLQRRLGRRIPQLFQIYGEPAFRDHETSILKGINPGLSVVSTGGGIVTREANWTEMRRLGIVVFVDVDFECLCERLDVSKKPRPLLQVDDWKEKLRALLDERLPLYAKADVTVNVTGLTIPEAGGALFEKLNQL